MENYKPTKQPIEKVKRFWEHNINPITGFVDTYNARLGSSSFVQTCPEPKFLKLSSNY